MNFNVAAAPLSADGNVGPAKVWPGFSVPLTGIKYLYGSAIGCDQHVALDQLFVPYGLDQAFIQGGEALVLVVFGNGKYGMAG